ncbi:hypothetical protein LguiB_031174 [Lonicera macranthoides]
MVFQRRLDYGFNGYQVPPTPRATRSARRRSSFKKKPDDNQMCAFDLLATVAGKLLVEGGNSPCSIDSLTGKEQTAFPKESVKKEQKAEDNNPSKLKPCDQSSCNRTFFVSEIVTQAPVVDHGSKEILNAQNDACSEFASVLTYSGCSEKVGSAAKSVHGESRIENGTFANKVDVGPSGSRAFFGCKLEDENKTQIKLEPPNTGKVPIHDRVDNCSSEENSVKLTCGAHSPRGSFPVFRDDVKLVRDDDENSSGRTQPSTLNKAFRPPPCLGDRRIRKILASKHWKVGPKLKDEDHFSTDAETKTVYRNRNNCYKRQRSLRDYPFKKRKLFDPGLEFDFDSGVSSDAISSSPVKGASVDASGLGATAQGATAPSAFGAGHSASFQPRDSHVKLKIKSFRVPELFIEIPETSTVGSLKRTVLEAVTAILSGGLRVGVLLQGKKIRDDNKTLVQTGISHNDKLDTLGFTLEPNPSQVTHPLCPKEHPILLPCETPKPLTRYLPASNLVQKVVQQGNLEASTDSPVTNFSILIESDHDSAPSPPDMSMEKSMTDSRALVPVPAATKMEALAVVPMRKSKRSDVAQRRIRRPFSVSEVEALVQAVEKLGTGRWRDVKLRAFDNAKHRTYVDLKDKWKTLVHTARISPQQRRGEPVPQELLDRVLTAHAYWSQQQAKQQIKQQSEACLLL